MSTGFSPGRALEHDQDLAWFKGCCERYGVMMADLQHLKEHCKDLRTVTDSHYIDIKTRREGQKGWAIEAACLEIKDLPVAFYLIEKRPTFRLRDVWWQHRVIQAVGDAKPREPTPNGSNDPWYLLSDHCELIP